jgi:hypothetical protein
MGASLKFLNETPHPGGINQTLDHDGDAHPRRHNTVTFDVVSIS